ncbi:MAG: FAD-dependent oxidoreductase [Methanomicrobiales archaeon]|nr:FAD-dependent oxidoreductase [Methanomicrobiales archaeon]
MPRVRIYSTENCPYCRMAKAFMDRHGIEYTNIDVGKDREAAREMIELSGQYGVPVIVIDDEVIVGLDMERLERLAGSERGEEAQDVVIIGAGPAGLTAAMYCARKSLRTLVIGADIGGQALWSWSIDNYMGYRMITGEELMKKFEEQVRELNIRLELDRVGAVSRENASFMVITASGRVYHARTLIIATGKRPRTLGLKEEDRYIGKGVSVCSTCDGPLYREKVVGVVGGGNSALQTAIEMSGIAKEVYLIVRSSMKADEILKDAYAKKKNVTTLLDTVVTSLYGEPFLQGITVKNMKSGEERKIEMDGLFLEIGLLPNTDFLGGFVELNDAGEVVVDINCHTSVEGVFAAGDVTNIKGKQIIIAAGEGAKAALEAYEYLVRR